ncbi:HD domain-containing protein [Hydrotalea sp.]|uniref:HD domain-containing protein n=1 Tax=Hydrotalea sp. TaxID=2881279 RepID=UPI00261D4C5F|nr:HD domain-containing protein [Hydrotalea sp.]
MKATQKIINDPVYGFITINHPLIFDIISHPYFQRLRRIHQMALAYLVYPGAVHTRLHHALGAYHLMCNAIAELKTKGVDITEEEEVAAKAAILLHDIGHGPFSHALENQLIQSVHHETISLALMQAMNRQLNGRLQMAIDIFTGNYHQPFLHQLISSQLDVDRMDYLTRDSFFTGVSEGVIGYDRIIKMLTVHDGQLMVEEKGIYSIEKFLVARRQMYWQVYLHKTVLSAEKMLVHILERVHFLIAAGNNSFRTGGVLDDFLYQPNSTLTDEILSRFCRLDDVDISFAIKKWAKHSDFNVNTLCNKLLNRQLLKIKLDAKPFTQTFLAEKIAEAAAHLNISKQDATNFVFTGEAVNTMYQPNDENIKILFKNGEVKDISAIDNPLIHQTISSPIKKFYICTLL